MNETLNAFRCCAAKIYETHFCWLTFRFTGICYCDIWCVCVCVLQRGRANTTQHYPKNQLFPSLVSSCCVRAYHSFAHIQCNSAEGQSKLRRKRNVHTERFNKRRGYGKHESDTSASLSMQTVNYAF